MFLLLAVTPIVLAACLILIFRQSALRAGFTGLAVTLVLSIVIPEYRLESAGFVFAISDGLLTTLGVAYVLLGGVLLYEVMQTGGVLTALSDAVIQAIPDRRHQMFALVFGVSVFFESATGFGVGIVVVAPLFLALGFDPLRAATLALIGQCAVPFGALAVGTVLGSDLSGVPEATLGELSVLISLPYLVVSGAAALFVSGLWRGSASDLGWLLAYSALLAVALWLGSISLGVELTGCFAGILIVFVAWCLNRSPALDEVVIHREGVPRFAIAIAPVVVLLGSLSATRLVEGIQHWFQSIGRIELEMFNFQIAPIYHPGFWLVVSAVSGVVILGLTTEQVKTIVPAAIKRWFTATLAIAGFIVFGKLMVLNGMTTQIATEFAQLAGRAYGGIVPVIGGLGGFLTASNAASNALFMNLQLTAGANAGMPPELVAASQNAAGSNTTLASPGRLVFASALIDRPGSEGELLRRVLPVALAGVAGAIIMTLVLERIGLN